ncbi:unnamed protein product [marine sediment metagenome]|uniref:Uncharacterized protein n=1 Tax=marine sediment metagenome TaxID=412755 RepID=X1MB94_9ZZZZ
MYLAFKAIPRPIERPCPRDPVAASTYGKLGVGCPSSLLPNSLMVSNSSSLTAPAAAHNEYINGEA